MENIILLEGKKPKKGKNNNKKETINLVFDREEKKENGTTVNNKA